MSNDTWLVVASAATFGSVFLTVCAIWWPRQKPAAKVHALTTEEAKALSVLVK